MQKSRWIEVSSFFDSPAIIRKMDRAKHKVMGQQGRYVRRVAMNSIKKPKDPSSNSLPGQPPSSKAGHLKKYIFYWYDTGRDAVVVGPAKFSASGYNRDYSVPQILEHGGRTVLRIKKRKGQANRVYRVNFRARPFMGPALQAALPHLAGMWKDELSKS